MEEPVEEEPRKIGRPPKKLGLKIRLKLKQRQMPMSKTVSRTYFPGGGILSEK